MKIQSSITTLCVVFVVLFGMGFQCGNQNKSLRKERSKANTRGAESPVKSETTSETDETEELNEQSLRTSPAGAPTEEEVKQAIDKSTREFYNASTGSKAYVSSWDSPITILSGREDMDNALDLNGDYLTYPVKVDYTVTVEGYSTKSYSDGALGFRKDAFGEWKYYTLEDYQQK
jgi:hypothetical protein